MPGRPCTVCQHAEAHPINIAIVQGESNRSVARSYGFSEQAVRRHRRQHLPELLVKAKEAVDVHQALDVVQQLKAINGASLSILKEARDARESGMALRAVDRVHRQIELQARLLGDIKEGPAVDIHLHPEYLKLEAVIISTLENYPDAFDAVHAAIKRANAQANASEGNALAEG